MIPGLGLYARMLTERNLCFARQIGAESIVVHMADYRAGLVAHDHFDRDAKGWDVSDARGVLWSVDELVAMRRLVERHGMRLAALENLNPALWHDVLLDGPERDRQIGDVCEIVRRIGRAGIPCLGIHFTIAGVWGHVYGDWARGGARTVGYLGPEGPEEPRMQRGAVWNRIYDPLLTTELLDPQPLAVVGERLDRFIDEVAPVAAEHGVRLAIHPDDPPVEVLREAGRPLSSVSALRGFLSRHCSEAVGLQLCVGTLGERADCDVVAAVREFSAAGRVAYVHLRNVRGHVPRYEEVFLDEGDIDVTGVLGVLAESGFAGTIIPDHTPLVDCEAPWHAGMAWALGWIRASIGGLNKKGSR